MADSRLASFWDLAAVVEAHTFGDDFSLAKLSPEQDREAQALGAKLVPEIKSGKYDQAFADNNCPYAECSDHSAASALQGYAGPIFALKNEPSKWYAPLKLLSNSFLMLLLNL